MFSISIFRGPFRLRQLKKVLFFIILDSLIFIAHLEIIVDSFCGNAILRGADIYSVGIIGCSASGMTRVETFHTNSTVDVGDLVSVYVDLDGKCLKGQTASYVGRKQFVGNGISLIVSLVTILLCIHCLLSQNRLRLFQSNDVNGVGIRMTDPIYRSPSFSDAFLQGMHLQNLPVFIWLDVSFF